jgi:hypothetical protein
MIKIKVKMKIKAKLKLKIKVRLITKALIQIIMIKARIQISKMIKLLPKNPSKKHTLAGKTRLPPLSDTEVSL